MVKLKQGATVLELYPATGQDSGSEASGVGGSTGRAALGAGSVAGDSNRDLWAARMKAGDRNRDPQAAGIFTLCFQCLCAISITFNETPYFKTDFKKLQFLLLLSQ